MLAVIIYDVILSIVGVLVLLIGLVWALPVASLTYALAHRNIFGVEAETTIKD